MHSTCWQNSILMMLWLGKNTYNKMCNLAKSNTKLCDKHKNIFETFLPDKYNTELCDRFIKLIITYRNNLFNNKYVDHCSIASLIICKDLLYNYKTPFNNDTKTLSVKTDIKTIDNNSPYILNPSGYKYDWFFFLLFITVKIYNCVCDFEIISSLDEIHVVTNDDNIIGYLFYLKDKRPKHQIKSGHMTSAF